jgi:hypothetical protein
MARELPLQVGIALESLLLGNGPKFIQVVIVRVNSLLVEWVGTLTHQLVHDDPDRPEVNTL